MSDSVSRQAAIDAVCSVCGDTECNIFDPDNKAKLYCPEPYAISKLPSAEPQWIPVSERLPEGSVLCCDRVGNIMIGCIFDDAGSDSGYSAVSESDFLYEVVAWMPLPEPYAEREENR